MDFGLKRMWNNLKEFSLRDLVSKVTSSNTEAEKSNTTTKSTYSRQNNELKDGNTMKYTFLKHISPFPFVRAEENSDENVNSWQDMVIKGPSSYYGMRKVFDDVLITNENNWQMLTKKLNGDDWELKLEGVSHFGDLNRLRLNMHGKMLTTGNLSPFFQIGDESKIGLNIKAHQLLSINAGISKKVGVEKLREDKLWSSATFQTSAAVLDIKVENIDYKESCNQNMEVSGVFGHNFGIFGVLSGFNLTLNSCNNFDWTQMCQHFSWGVVFRRNATVLTIEPNSKLVTIESRLKINDSFDSVIRLKTCYDSPTWTLNNNEIGLKYKHSENVTCVVKSDLAGNVTAGTSFNTLSSKVALFLKTSIVQNVGCIENIGISVEI